MGMILLLLAIYFVFRLVFSTVSLVFKLIVFGLPLLVIFWLVAVVLKMTIAVALVAAAGYYAYRNFA